jgi:hypothetical protein
MPSAPKLQAPQGHPLFDVQLRAISESLAGNGVLSNGDLEVTAGTNAMEIDVAAGTAYYLATEYTYGGASPAATLSTGDGTDDRWDTVAFDTATTSVTVYEGTPELYPTADDIQGDELLLAIVYVPAGATDIDNSNILNWRAKFSNEAEEVHYDDDTGVYGVSNVDAALDELQEAAQISAYPLAPATDLNVNGYPFQNSDLANSTVDVGAGTGLTTTNVSIGLGGSATVSIATDGVTDTELDLSITPTWTSEHTWDAAQVMAHLPTPANPAAGYDKTYFKNDHFLYSLDENGRERRVGGDVKSAAVTANYTTQYEDILFVDPSGTGGLTVTLASADAQDGHGIMVIDTGAAAGDNPITIDTEGTETIDGGSSKMIESDSAELLLESDGSDWYTAGGAAAVGVNTQSFSTDESGSVASGNAGVVYVTEVPDGDRLDILQAGLILADGQAAPSDLDLVIATMDNSGVATKQTTIIAGDGTVQAHETGDPLAQYSNTSGGAQTVAILIDNGNFNAGTGASQDVSADAQGEIV